MKTVKQSSHLNLHKNKMKDGSDGLLVPPEQMLATAGQLRKNQHKTYYEEL
jgi:hypothetical protein